MTSCGQVTNDGSFRVHEASVAPLSGGVLPFLRELVSHLDVLMLAQPLSTLDTGAAERHLC